MPQTAVDALRRQVDLSITVFRAGFVTLLLAVGAFAYLWFVTVGLDTFAGVLIVGVLLAVIPVLCFIIGLLGYAPAARTLRVVHGDQVSGLLRRRSAGLAPKRADSKPVTVDEASWQDIISRLGEDESR